MKTFLLIALMFFVLPVTAEPRLVSITGESEFEVEADIINIGFSITNQSETNLSKGNEKINTIAQAVIGELVALGISEEDIYSPSFNFERERRSYDDKECLGEYYPHVSRRMNVQLKDIEKYTDVIDLLLKNEVTSIDDINSEVSDFDKQTNEAMNLAILDAKRQAKFYVESFGGKLGKIYSIGRKNSSYDRWGNSEEIVVTGTRNTLPRKVQPYKFKPAPVTIDASIYVEFEID